MLVCIDKITCARMLQLIQPRWQAKAAAVRAEAEAKLAEAVAATDEIVGTALKARLADLDCFWEKEQTVTYHRRCQSCRLAQLSRPDR